MLKTQIKISRKDNGKVQYLTEVLPVIPTNTILCKTLTGLGATYSELKAPRHSIICEPNLPVIKGKAGQHKHSNDNIFGVYEGVYHDDIVNYIEETLRKDKYIKIMTTPESFQKVVEAVSDTELDIRFDCFMLFDECHKLISDVDFRSSITLPLDLFFQCENKALVSATPQSFTDPRFDDFQIIEIKPDFEIRRTVNLYITNNVLQRFREFLETAPTDKKLFIFCNSTDAIYALMTQIGIADESAVFCSRKSVEKLRMRDFRQVYDTWELDKSKRFNFLTSRFFSAVDIELKEKPVVVFITDTYFAKHTCLDPYTDVIQCVGRFRNGVSEIHHISNTNSTFRAMNLEELKGYVLCQRDTYRKILMFRDSTTVPGHKEAYDSCLDCLPYKQWLNADGSENFFLIDNFITDEMLMGYYAQDSNLVEAYRKHFNVVLDTKEPYKLGDHERLQLQRTSALTQKERREIIVTHLEMLGKCETEFDFIWYDDLMKADKLIVEAYDVLGADMIRELKYRTKALKQAIIVARFKNHPCGNEVVKMMNTSFEEGHWYDATYIKREIKRIHDIFGVKYTKAVTSHTIREYFDAVEQRKGNKRGFRIIRGKTV